MRLKAREACSTTALLTRVGAVRWRRDPFDPFRFGVERPAQHLVKRHALFARGCAIEAIVSRRGSEEVGQREDEEEGQDEEGWEQDEEATAALRGGTVARVSFKRVHAQEE